MTNIEDSDIPSQKQDAGELGKGNDLPWSTCCRYCNISPSNLPWIDSITNNNSSLIQTKNHLLSHTYVILITYLKLGDIIAILDDGEPEVKPATQLKQVVCLLLGPRWLSKMLLYHHTINNSYMTSTPPTLHSSTPPAHHSSTPPTLHTSTHPTLHSSTHQHLTPPTLHSSTHPTLHSSTHQHLTPPHLQHFTPPHIQHFPTLHSSTSPTRQTSTPAHISRPHQHTSAVYTSTHQSSTPAHISRPHQHTSVVHTSTHQSSTPAHISRPHQQRFPYISCSNDATIFFYGYENSYLLAIPVSDVSVQSNGW